MTKQDFIKALYEAGWTAPGDAQHENIVQLWRKLNPGIAQLEDELEAAKEKIEELEDRDPFYPDDLVEEMKND